MDIDWYERNWIIISAVTLLILFGVTLYGAFGLGMEVEGDIGQVNPATVRTTAPFDSPGLVQVGDKHYKATIIAEAWRFTPAEIRIPVGATVDFTMTSTDVIHGFKIPLTTVNRMIIPGQVTKVSHTFHQPGRFSFFCHEYCGVGHHVMDGVIVVE